MHNRNTTHPVRDTATIFRPTGLDGLEFMHATYARHAFPPHMHGNYVIELVESGVDESLCGGQTIRAPAGTIVAINPWQVHAGRPGGSAVLSYRAVYSSIGALSNLFGRDASDTAHAPRFRSPVISDAPLARLLHRAHRQMERSPDDAKSHALMISALARLAARHMTCDRPRHDQANNHPGVSRARRHLLENLTRAVPLDELSEVAFLSPFHLARSFHRECGLPPHQFQMNARVELARRLLREGDSIGRIATETGFADQSHLTRLFRRYVGISPGNYKNSKFVQDQAA